MLGTGTALDGGTMLQGCALGGGTGDNMFLDHAKGNSLRHRATLLQSRAAFRRTDVAGGEHGRRRGTREEKVLADARRDGVLAANSQQRKEGHVH